jgi:hypothetical protein
VATTTRVTGIPSRVARTYIQVMTRVMSVGGMVVSRVAIDMGMGDMIVCSRIGGVWIHLDTVDADIRH